MHIPRRNSRTRRREREKFVARMVAATKRYCNGEETEEHATPPSSSEEELPLGTSIGKVPHDSDTSEEDHGNGMKQIPGSPKKMKKMKEEEESNGSFKISPSVRADYNPGNGMKQIPGSPKKRKRVREDEESDGPLKLSPNVRAHCNPRNGMKQIPGSPKKRKNVEEEEESDGPWKLSPNVRAHCNPRNGMKQIPGSPKKRKNVEEEEESDGPWKVSPYVSVDADHKTVYANNNMPYQRCDAGIHMPKEAYGLVPVQVTGDGNCLFDSARLLVGTNFNGVTAKELRLKVCREMVSHLSRYVYMSVAYIVHHVATITDCIDESDPASIETLDRKGALEFLTSVLTGRGELFGSDDTDLSDDMLVMYASLMDDPKFNGSKLHGAIDFLRPYFYDGLRDDLRQMMQSEGDAPRYASLPYVMGLATVMDMPIRVLKGAMYTFANANGFFKPRKPLDVEGDVYKMDYSIPALLRVANERAVSDEEYYSLIYTRKVMTLLFSRCCMNRVEHTPNHFVPMVPENFREQLPEFSPGQRSHIQSAGGTGRSKPSPLGRTMRTMPISPTDKQVTVSADRLEAARKHFKNRSEESKKKAYPIPSREELDNIKKQLFTEEPSIGGTIK